MRFLRLLLLIASAIFTADWESYAQEKSGMTDSLSWETHLWEFWEEDVGSWTSVYGGFHFDDMNPSHRHQGTVGQRLGVLLQQEYRFLSPLSLMMEWQWYRYMTGDDPQPHSSMVFDGALKLRVPIHLMTLYGQVGYGVSTSSWFGLLAASGFEARITHGLSLSFQLRRGLNAETASSTFFLAGVSLRD